MRTISNTELKAAARQAYLEGRLCAQFTDGRVGDLPNGGCTYAIVINGKTYNCAIGAALTESEIIGTDLSYTISALEHNGIVYFQDSNFAQNLQYAHDDWAMGQKSEKDFRQLVDLD